MESFTKFLVALVGDIGFAFLVGDPKVGFLVGDPPGFVFFGDSNCGIKPK
jgi:hypothetical protein